MVRDSWIEEKQNTKNLLRYDEPTMSDRKMNGIEMEW